MEQEQSTIIEDNTPSSPDSWIELGSRGPCSEAATPPHMLQYGIMQQLTAQAVEKLLADAQREGGGSGTLSRGSAVTPPLSPINMDGVLTASGNKIPRADNDWLWDWSSRMEKSPPSGYMHRVRHPSSNGSLAAADRCRSDYHTGSNSSPWTWRHFTTLIISHASTFLLGAALVFFAMKRGWTIKSFILPRFY